MYIMKYLQRPSLHIGLCLLLVCSVNVASAQFVVNLSEPQTNGLTIRFDVNFGGSVTGDQRIIAQIRIDDIDLEDIRSFMPLSNQECKNFNNFIRVSDTPPSNTLFVWGREHEEP